MRVGVAEMFIQGSAAREQGAAMMPFPLPSIVAALALVATLGTAAAAQDAATGRTRSLGGAATAIAPSPSAGGYSATGTCLSSADGRRVIQSSGAISLATAAQVARGASPGEIVDYKICEAEAGYSYVLTILGRDGKVARAWVDAASGKLVTVR
jgi:uncharacterized membrane protein YkoI